MSLQRSGPPALQQVPTAESMSAAAHHATPGSGAEQPFFRLDIVRAFELHRKLALGFAIAGLVLAVAYAVLTWPRYTAESQIYIQPTSAKIMDQGNAQRWPYDSNSYDSFLQQQVQLASNPDVLVSAVQKLPAGSWQRAGESDQAAAERLAGVLKVERLGSSYQVAITAQAKSAEMAADIANAVANSVVEKAAHEANAGDTQRLAILQGERDRVQNQLNADLTEQDALNKQLGMAAVGTEAPDLIDNAIGSTREELIKARTDHDEAEARFAAMGNGRSSAALDAEADELVTSDPGLTSMKTSLNQRRATLITQMANLTPNNPEYKLDSEELNKINASLDAMMKDLRAKAAARIQERLRTDLERTSGVEAQLNGQLRQLAETAASATPKLQRANDLATDIVRLRTRYAAVDEELHDIMLQDSVPGAVHLSVAAVPPLHPSLSGILRKSVPLALGGILLGLFAALLANHLDQRVYIAADVEHLLGFAPMAALPDFEEVPEAVFEEHVLRLATAIEHARKQGSLRTCIFTGTGTGAGVSTVVTRVREMLASMGRLTVLVNASGTAQPAARTAAQPVADKSGTLATERGTRSLALLRRVTEESGTQDESLVLADTAPLLMSAETEYLARFVDCVVVVVESGATTRAELRATADALQRLNASAMGLVLNRVGLAKADAAFRNSVCGVETHLRLQGRANQRPSSHPHHFAKEAPSAPERPHPVARPVYADAEPLVQPIAVQPTRAEQCRPEQAEAARVGAEQAAANRIPEEQVEARNVEPTASFVPQHTAAVVGAALRQEPVALAPEKDLPWWLSETPSTAPVSDRAPAQDARGADATASQPKSDERVRPASRLSGLRNVLFGTGSPRGIENRRPEQQEPAAEESVLAAYEPRAKLEPGAFETQRFDPTPVEPRWLESAPLDGRRLTPAAPAPVFAPAAEFIALYTPVSEPIATQDKRAEVEYDTPHVVAAPEFLPPQSMVTTRVRPDARESEAMGRSGRLERGDALDDIQVLPSRRGQYRRSRNG